MFAVPDAEQVCFYLGPTPRGISSAVFEICDERPGSISLRSDPSWRQVVTLSVVPGRRGATKACIAASRSVRIAQKLGVEGALRADLKAWLRALRAVSEDRAPWPASTIPAELHRACMTLPAIRGHEVVSADVLIRAHHDEVWQAVYSPHTHTLHSRSAVCAGFVPGTPQGHVGEMQYFIDRRSDQSLRSCAIAVTELSPERSALTHRVGPPHDQTAYLLTDEAGGTRLALTWRGPNLRDDDDPETSLMAQHLQAAADEHKAVIESASP